MRGHRYPHPTSDKDRIIAAMSDPERRLPGDPALLRYHVTDDLIDQIAADVRQLPATLTVGQRERLRIIGRELTRRGK